MDLIKNYLFRKIPTRIDEVVDLWEKILNNTKDADLNQFLHHYWCALHEEVRKSDVYKRFKDQVQTREEAWSEIERISVCSELYKSLKNPSVDDWDDKDIVKYLKALRTFKLEQVYILLLAIAYKFSDDTIRMKEFVKIILIFSLKYSVICKGPANTLLVKYIEWANKIVRDEMDYQAFLSDVKAMTPSETRIRDSFMQLEPSNDLGRYLLLEINNKLRSERHGKDELSFDLDLIHLEHIIPIKWESNQEWVKYFSEQGFYNPVESGNDLDRNHINETVRSLGNMTLLQSEFNKRAQNKFFLFKRDNIYNMSSVPTTRRLLDIDNFYKEQVWQQLEFFFEEFKVIWRY